MSNENDSGVIIHSLRYPADLRDAIDEKAEQEGISRSEAIRRAMAEWAGDPELATMPAASQGAAAMANQRYEWARE